MKADLELQKEGMINSLTHAGKAAFHLISVSIRMQVAITRHGFVHRRHIIFEISGIVQVSHLYA